MSNQEALLQILNLSIQSSGGRIHDLQFTGDCGSLVVFASDDLRRITALFRTILGLELPLEGSVVFKGQGMGLVLSEDELPLWSTARRELGLFAALHGLSRYDLTEAMGRWDLEGILSLALRHLNAYEKTGLFLVMETSLAPDVLLCQEPLAGLNPRQTVKMLEHLEEYSKDHLVILGTVNPDHYPESLPRVDLDRQSLFLKKPPAWDATEDPVNTESAPLEDGRPLRSAPGGRFDLAQPAPTPTAVVDHLVPVTVPLPLMVGEATEYELRRISQIKFFEPAEDGQGYLADILPADRALLKDLLVRRGLSLPDDWEG